MNDTPDEPVFRSIYPSLGIDDITLKPSNFYQRDQQNTFFQPNNQPNMWNQPNPPNTQPITWSQTNAQPNPVTPTGVRIQPNTVVHNFNPINFIPPPRVGPVGLPPIGIRAPRIGR